MPSPARRPKNWPHALRVGVILERVPHVFEYERDPDDAHYVDVAVEADAKLIVSRDKDLLDLMDAARPEARAFQSRFPSLRIIDPVKLLRELDDHPHAQPG